MKDLFVVQLENSNLRVANDDLMDEHAELLATQRANRDEIQLLRDYNDRLHTEIAQAERRVMDSAVELAAQRARADQEAAHATRAERERDEARERAERLAARLAARLRELSHGDGDA